MRITEKIIKYIVEGTIEKLKENGTVILKRDEPTVVEDTRFGSTIVKHRKCCGIQCRCDTFQGLG